MFGAGKYQLIKMMAFEAMFEFPSHL